MDSCSHCKLLTVWTGARPKCTGVCCTNPQWIATSEWTLNLVEVPLVNMAGLVIYLMDMCNWKDNAVHRNQLFGKGNICDVKIHKASASYIYVGAGCIRYSRLPRGRHRIHLVWVFMSTDGKDISGACERKFKNCDIYH